MISVIYNYKNPESFKIAYWCNNFIYDLNYVVNYTTPRYKYEKNIYNDNNYKNDNNYNYTYKNNKDQY